MFQLAQQMRQSLFRGALTEIRNPRPQNSFVDEGGIAQRHGDRGVSIHHVPERLDAHPGQPDSGQGADCKVNWVREITVAATKVAPNEQRNNLPPAGADILIPTGHARGQNDNGPLGLTLENDRGAGFKPFGALKQILQGCSFKIAQPRQQMQSLDKRTYVRSSFLSHVRQIGHRTLSTSYAVEAIGDFSPIFWTDRSPCAT